MGADVPVNNTLSAGECAVLEWMPQETIVFDGARLRRETRIKAAATARVLAGEILVFGRAAHGEWLRNGLIHDVWEVRRDDTLVWRDALHMQDDLAGVLNHPAGFDGARAAATLVWSGESRLDDARALLANSAVRAGATEIEDILVVRWLDKDATAVRAEFARFWAGFRARVLNAPARVPRLWSM